MKKLKPLKYLSIPFSVILLTLSIWAVGKGYDDSLYNPSPSIILKLGSETNLHIVSLSVFAVGAFFAFFAVKHIVRLLRKLSVKKRVLLTSCVFVFDLIAALFILYKLITLPDYFDRSVLLLFFFAFSVFGILIAAAVVYMLLSYWRGKNEKSFKTTATAIGAISSIAFAVSSVSFFRMLKFVESDDYGWYIMAASVCLVVSVALALSAASLYVKRLSFAAVKGCVCFLIVFGFCLALFVGLLDGVGGVYKTIKAEAGIAVLGLDGDGILYLGKDSKGTEYYLAASWREYGNFATAREKEATEKGIDWIECVYMRGRPFAGAVHFEYKPF